MNLTIIGGGRAAWAFASGWRTAGWAVDAIVLRERSTSPLPELLDTRRTSLDEFQPSEAVLVAVPDDALPTICAKVAERCSTGTWLFHASGSHDSALFGERARAFSLHPLRALPPPGGSDPLVGALLVFEGGNEARETAMLITRRLGARFATIPREGKLAYHAAAVIASNLVAAQLETASTMMKGGGLDVDDVRAEIGELARSAVGVWSEREGADRFTGPIARGDAGLVRRHLAALDFDPEASRIYRAAGLALCRALRKAKPEDRDLAEIERLLASSLLP